MYTSSISFNIHTNPETYTYFLEKKFLILSKIFSDCKACERQYHDWTEILVNYKFCAFPTRHNS